MDKPRIRPAIAADVPAIAKIVDHAYRHYIARMGKPPGPMLEDYAARVNIAVSPNHQGLGLGRRLLAFAETEALRRGYREIRLYTHQTMVENQRLYASIGYQETGRGTEAGYERVFMRKPLCVYKGAKPLSSSDPGRGREGPTFGAWRRAAPG